METIKIMKSSPDESKPYFHLKPIVDALINNDNTFSNPIDGFEPNEDGFYKDKDGWKCDFSKPIDFDFIQSLFLLPDSIQLSKKDDSILCILSWVEIRGNIS